MKVILLQEATDGLGIKLPVILIVIEVGELVGHIDAMEGKKCGLRKDEWAVRPRLVKPENREL